MNTTVTRNTKYVDAVTEALSVLRHATNHELLEVVRREYPEVSATTIHRVTARLCDRGSIGRAPRAEDGSERYDVSTDPHHHFTCSGCGLLCDMPDTPEARDVVSKLKKLTGECALAGSLTMRGTCRLCVT